MWIGPPQEIITTKDLLYASLLMSLLAAFVAMLGKQWLNRFIRHTGGSMVERCGDRQRKFDGIEKWPFHFFIESLPAMLQIALLLLACGLSRYMWSVNVSVARVVISFTLLGFLFYIGIVVAGISSYECPFQTPLSTALRSSFPGLSLPNVTQLIYATRRNIQKFLQRATLLPLTDRPQTPLNGLRLPVRDLEALRRQNLDNAGCVCWILRKITDPEAIDSAIRLAGIIQWFDGGCNDKPPYDLIVSIFEACFDSTRQLYPNMRDRAYFSARAILQINVRARAQPHDLASQYPIPHVSSTSVERADPVLRHMISILEKSSSNNFAILYFPREGIHSQVHSLWVSSLFVGLANTKRFTSVEPLEAYLSVAVINNQAMIANVLLMWYKLLGGHIEEETIWTFGKAYVVSDCHLLSLLNVVYTSDSLQSILSHLSTRVERAIIDMGCPRHFEHLLAFLVAWKQRPVCLARMAYRWGSIISQVAQNIRPENILPFDSRPTPLGLLIQTHYFTGGDETPPRDLDYTEYANLVSSALEVGFRLHDPHHGRSALHLSHTPYHDQMFKTAFSSNSDETIADAACIWIADSAGRPPSPITGYLARRAKSATPFSPRLRRVLISVIERVWERELEASGLEIVQLLNRLEAGVDDIVDGKSWVRLLISAIRLVTGPEGLFPCYWDLLDKFASDKSQVFPRFKPRDVEVMRSLEDAEDWEKLETWMVLTWQSGVDEAPALDSMGDINRATLKLLLRRRSALPRFEDLSDPNRILRYSKFRVEHLQRILDQAQEEQPPVESPSPP